MVKFRTLDDRGKVLRLGLWLRKTSLDELPELFNVVKGEMSLVGPRPLLVEYAPYFSLNQWRRHDVLPGITGLAQINGRDALGWDKKFKFDLEYVRNNSRIGDLVILIRTIGLTITQSGNRSVDPLTEERFSDFVERTSFKR